MMEIVFPIRMAVAVAFTHVLWIMIPRYDMCSSPGDSGLESIDFHGACLTSGVSRA